MSKVPNEENISHEGTKETQTDTKVDDSPTVEENHQGQPEQLSQNVEEKNAGQDGKFVKLSINTENLDVQEQKEEQSSQHSPTNHDWMVPVHLFKIEPLDRHKSKKVKQFYEKQNQLIHHYKKIHTRSKRSLSMADEPETVPRCDCSTVVINISYICNILLFICKITAAILSGSLPVFTSTLDSALDLLSGFILWFTNFLRKRKSPKDKIQYPVGKARLEPIGFIIFACVMGTASLQIIIEGSTQIVTQLFEDPAGPSDKGSYIYFWVGLGMLLLTMLVKSILYIICRPLTKYPAVQAYAQDHRNDVLTNAVLAGSMALTRFVNYCWWVGDFISIIISLYIIITWIRASWEHVKKLVGMSAEPEFLNYLTHIVYNHSKKIHKIDSVQAFYSGAKLYAEVHIVVPEDMPVKEAHDIGETLQIKLEQLEDVERAFVHVDYEWEHTRDDEHKTVI